MRTRAYKKSGKTPLLSATAASFAISRAFFARRSRCREHFSRIVALGFAAAVGTFYLVQIAFNKLVEFFITFHAFIL